MNVSSGSIVRIVDTDCDAEMAWEAHSVKRLDVIQSSPSSSMEMASHLP